jgi:hypothetical protein
VLTKIMKLVSIAALVLAAFFWRSSANFQTVVQFLVCGAAALVVIQAARSGKYLWAVVFCVVAVLFNPLAPLTLPGSMFLWVDLLCLSMFLAATAYLRTSPRLSVESVTNPGPRSESL